eukprot:TRINITY_DN28853_c0_g1_i1.p1 TRINITY_DN28853_c0_g1~~TRINITY_DN28853_c0_g1_i1.p1  ORF type:complete len:124 (-),score=9.81 TRINITY_DN28853_c0_g1_i1:35-382(-)
MGEYVALRPGQSSHGAIRMMARSDVALFIVDQCTSPDACYENVPVAVMGKVAPKVGAKDLHEKLAEIGQFLPTSVKYAGRFVALSVAVAATAFVVQKAFPNWSFKSLLRRRLIIH